MNKCMDIEALLLEQLSKEQLEVLVAERISSFHGLLTREIALKLIAKEKGLLKEEEKKTKIKDIEKDSRKLIIVAKIKKIWPTAKYKSGKQSRVIEIEDSTGVMPLLLWNDDVSLVQKINTLDQVEIQGAYERGGEIHLGYIGQVKLIEKAKFTNLDELIDNEYVHIRGKISEIEGFDRFVDGSDSKPAFSFFITNGKKKVQVLIWKNPERGCGLSPGDEVLIEGALTKNGRIELSEEARVLRRRKNELLLGEIKEIKEKDDSIEVIVGEKKVELDRINSLRFMGLELAPDIELSTVVKLKKDYLIKNNVALKIKEEKGKTIIVK
jgi:hypothetical protein